MFPQKSQFMVSACKFLHAAYMKMFYNKEIIITLLKRSEIEKEEEEYTKEI